MAGYVTHIETEVSFGEIKLPLKCRIKDIDKISNINWNNKGIRKG